MNKIKLKIFNNLKNFYELTYEIAKEKNLEKKKLPQQVARQIYNELQQLSLFHKTIFNEMNALFKNVNSLQDVMKIKVAQ